MRTIKQLFILLLPLISLPCNLFSQNNNILNLNSGNYISTDTTKQVQYRRTIEPTENQQSYEQKYFGKDLNEVRRSLFPLESTGIWTELNPKVPRVDYLGVHFINKDTGWACGDLGALIKTTNGGEDWTVSQTNTTTPILKVKSFNGQIVIASGYDGLILRSVDGGETFTQVTSNVTGDLWGLQMINDTLGWACGMGSSLIRTTNTGETWQTVTTGLNTNYWWLDFINELIGFIACDNGIVLKTTDGGINWQQYQAGNNWALYTIDAIDSLHIAAGGANDKNVYSSDGGITWTENFRLIFDDVNCIAFADADTGYAIGLEWGIRKTTDRGITWFASNSNIGEWHIQILPGFYGYTAGGDLKIYKTEGWYDNWKSFFLIANFNDVHFINKYKGFAVSGILYSTTDGGENWVLRNVPGGQAIIFSDSLHGCIGSSYQSSTAIYRTSDGGENWELANITGLVDTGGQITKIFFINPTTGWAVTNRGGIIKTTDAGENWFTQLNTFNFVGFWSIHFTDTVNGWTANGNRRPHKTTDGGENWLEQTNLVYFQTRDVYFINTITGWLLRNNELVKTTNSGLSWTTIPNITGIFFQFIFFNDSDHWLVYGNNKYETTDGGETWQDVTQFVPSFNNFHSPLEGIGYACGGLGLILKYVDTSIVPIELNSFDAEVSDDKVTLKWQTSTEINNFGFEIERRKQDNDWQTIGFVKGSGTTSELINYAFTDKLYEESQYHYRLKQIDYNGSFKYYESIEVNFQIINEYFLYQNYPNPFNPGTIIKYSLKDNGRVTIKIYNLLGEEVKTLVDEIKSAGNYEAEFSVTGSAGNLPSGVYLYRIQAGDFVSSKKMLFLK